MTSASPRAVAVVAALLTARCTGAPVAQADLLDGADIEEVVSVLVSLNSSLLRQTFPDGGESLLRDLGWLGARP